MTVELKPCPFCGGTSISKDGVLEQQKFCENCGSYGPRPAFDYDDAIWNDRPLEDAKDQRIAELEAALKPFAFLNWDSTQEFWGVRNEAIAYWFSYDDLEAARASLTKQEGADHG